MFFVLVPEGRLLRLVCAFFVYRGTVWQKQLYMTLTVATHSSMDRSYAQQVLVSCDVDFCC